MNKKSDHRKNKAKLAICGSKEKTPLKKNILEDLHSHNTFAILSSKGKQDFAILFVNQTQCELYQIKTVAAVPLRHGVDPEIARKFYAERIAHILKMINANKAKTLILDYNLSFWAHVNNVNLSTYIIENSNVGKVWTYPKTRLSKPETLVKRGEEILTESGTIALSFLRSYYPNLIKDVRIVDQDIDKCVEQDFKINKNQFSVFLDEVFDRENEKKKHQTLEALEWALSQSKKIRNPSFVEVFQRLIATAKAPILSKKKQKS